MMLAAVMVLSAATPSYAAYGGGEAQPGGYAAEHGAAHTAEEAPPAAPEPELTRPDAPEHNPPAANEPEPEQPEPDTPGEEPPAEGETEPEPYTTEEGLGTGVEPQVQTGEISGIIAADFVTLALLPPPGAGTPGDPWLISEAAHLQWIGATNAVVPDPNRAARRAGSYLLMNDIDATSIGNDAIITGSDSFNVDSFFIGDFDGGGHTITIAVSLAAGADNQSAGLFRGIGHLGSVRNLHVAGSVDGDHPSIGLGVGVGGLTGLNSGAIINVHSSVVVSGSDEVGGLVGVNRGSISRSSASGDVSSRNGNAGGLVARNEWDATITDSYATVNVHAGGGGTFLRSAGGVVAWNEGTIQNTYATGTITGFIAGGIFGRSINYDSAASNNVALNSNVVVVPDGFIGRIRGEVEDHLEYVLAGNRASAGVRINGLPFAGVGRLDNNYGETVSAATIGTEQFWSDTMGWDLEDVWEWNQAFGRPILRNHPGIQGYVALPVAHIVTFELDDGVRVGGGALEQIVLPNGDAVLPNAEHPLGWNLAGWDGSYTGVTSDRTITALWLEPLVINSADSTTFTVGEAGSFFVTATNYPAFFAVAGDALPDGVDFDTDTGELHGTPEDDTEGVYDLIFTAYNDGGASVPQSFTLTVVPAVPSGVGFVAGVPGVYDEADSGRAHNRSAFAPNITRQPRPAQVYAREAAYLYVTAESPNAGTMTFQWQRAEGASGGRFVNIPNAIGSAFSPNTDALGVNRYRVVVTNTVSPQNWRLAGAEGPQTARVFSRTVAVTVTERETMPVMSVSPTPFADVSIHDWFYPFVRAVWEQQLFSGTSYGTFSAQGGMTRAMFVQVLANIDGVDLAAYAGAAGPRFADTSPGAWYFGAVQWAAGQGLTSGTGGGNFAPDSPVTRQEMAVLLHNFIQHRGIELPYYAASPFSDHAGISEWAADGVMAVRAAGIINGYTDGSFRPDNTATRAEAAAIFARFLEAADLPRRSSMVYTSQE